MTAPALVHPRLRRVRLWSTVIGAVGLVVCLVGALFDAAAVAPAYLSAMLTWIMLPVGALAILMLHYLSGGRWGISAGRTLRAAAATLPIMALLFLPLLFGLGVIFPWAGEGAEQVPHVVAEKLLYLDATFLIVRTLLYFVIWLALAWAVHVWTDIGRGRIADEWARSRRRGWSAFGLILWGLAVTFFSVDWIMALEPEWHSTIFGFLIAGSMTVAAFAFVVLSTSLFGGWIETPAAEVADRRQDLANFLLSFILMWFYLAYMQYLIIWSGDLPDEIVWYVHRSEAGWIPVILLIVALHFVLPFAALISPAVKRGAVGAAVAAALLLAGHALHVYWMVIPAFHTDGFALPWPVLPALLGVGGLWLLAFLWRLEGRALWPLRRRREDRVHA